MRHLIGLGIVCAVALGSGGCNREKNDPAASAAASPTAPAATPATVRETVFVQLDVAIGPAVAPLDVLGGFLSAGGGSEDPWKPDPRGLPAMAASKQPIEGDVYVDEGFMSVALSGAATPFYADWSANELGKALAAIATRPGVAGASLYQLDDRNGSVVHVAAVAGRDLPEAAMALIDLWAPELDVDYSAVDPAEMKQDGAPSRAGLIGTLRARKTLDAEVRRVAGVKVRKESGAVLVGFPATEPERSRELATRIATDLGLIADRQ